MIADEQQWQSEAMARVQSRRDYVDVYRYTCMVREVNRIQDPKKLYALCSIRQPSVMFIMLHFLIGHALSVNPDAVYRRTSVAVQG